MQIQLKAHDSADWASLGPLDTQAPFETNLDPAALTYGAYDLRAIATDQGGRTDPDPPDPLMHAALVMRRAQRRAVPVVVGAAIRAEHDVVAVQVPVGRAARHRAADHGDPAGRDVPLPVPELR